MKKNSILLIFILLSLTGFSQAVIWIPDNGSYYGDKMRITVDFDLNYIENQFIGYGEGAIIDTPTYYLNGFYAPANYFEYQDNNAMYVSQLAYPELYVSEDVNTIAISYLTSDNILHYDTAEYYYSKPVLECQLVNGEAYVPGMLLVNPENLTMNVVIKSSWHNLPVSQITGDDFVSEVYQVFDGSNASINNDIPDTRYLETSLDIDISGLTYGLHEVELFAKGRKADDSYPDEFSESIKIRILIFDFVIENDDDYSVCKCDSVYFLTGLPEGGIFSGDCVLESSNVFNPQTITGSSTEITYRYPVDNIYYPLPKTINFDPLPVLDSIDANPQGGYPHEVCGYEHGVAYELKGSGYTDLKWSLPDEIIKYSYIEDINKVIIDWDQSGDGTISVTATSDKGCITTLDHMIHISGIHKVPIDSAYVTVLDKMLFCDADTNIIKFFYFHAIIGADTIDYPVTTKPYYYLEFKPDPSNSFFVSTALDETSCTTDSHMYPYKKSQEVVEENDPSVVKIFPNPTNGNINCEFLMPFSSGLITITNLLGQEIDRVEYDNIVAGTIVRLETGEYQRGIYFLNFSNNSISRSYKFIVY
jgi:hypothetical protein